MAPKWKKVTTTTISLSAIAMYLHYVGQFDALTHKYFFCDDNIANCN